MPELSQSALTDSIRSRWGFSSIILNPAPPMDPPNI